MTTTQRQARMSYLKDLKLILTLHVNQFLINMEKRIFALLRGLLCRQKRPRQKLFELAVCDQFESSHRSLSNVIVVLISSPPPLLPSPPRSKHGFYTHFTRPQTGVGEGGRICHYFDTELPPASINTLLCTVSRSFGPNVQYLTGKVI